MVRVRELVASSAFEDTVVLPELGPETSTRLIVVCGGGPSRAAALAQRLREEWTERFAAQVAGLQLETSVQPLVTAGGSEARRIQEVIRAVERLAQGAEA